MERISSNDTSSTDTMLARLKEQLETIKKSTQRNGNRSTIKTGSKKINLTGYMIQLANAKTTIQVDGVIRAVEAEARSMKLKGATAREAASAIRLARKVRDKGTIKISRLRKEENLKRLSDLHKSSKNLSKANEVLKLLKSKKRARKAQEQNDILHSLKTDRYDETYVVQSHMEPGLSDNSIAVSAEIAGAEISLTDSIPDMGGIDYLT